MANYLMSTTVIPAGADGLWRMESVSLETVQIILHSENSAGGAISAVGHEATAEIMSELLGAKVLPNRITVSPVKGDIFYCFKLDKRPPEGVILDREQLEEIGYSWAKMTFIG